MVRRVAATQATLDKFKDDPHAWGTRDCARKVAFHLRQAGYRPPLAKAGSYKTYRGARAALKRAGFTTLGAALDSMGLERIPPAAALVGDVVELPSEDELGALGIALGNGRDCAYHPDAIGAAVLQPVETPSAAWRVVF